ncbi:signal transduction histidine kinase [Kibdelosporangium banguiense]|uniref:histidine kinase n=1 Tax=Kibdelosporangium banguiense TaxID=1365924 RepID=A0ABS4TAM3_9PSEU|nr:signal transduction histidine kinase [Kibdelosporangium banguiense]
MRWSARARLTAMYGGLFMAIGVILLVINYLLVLGALPSGVAVARQAGIAPEEWTTAAAPTRTVTPTVPGTTPDRIVVDTLDNYRSGTMATVLWTSGIALLAGGVIATLASWYMAGRVLRPVHAITATARRLGAQNLNRRINLDGPDDELKELANTFDGMLDRLATAFDSQTHFVANASHELRTPLAVQRTLVEVAMADPAATPEMKRLGQHLLHTNERSERLIEGLLVLARSDRGLLSRVPVRLDKVTENVVAMCSDLASQHEVTVQTKITSRGVPGDPVLLERLVTNLVQNAIRYNEPGGSVSVEVGDSPAVRVVNSGPAVPVESLPGLFEPFRRLERTSTSGGSGLGLSIVASVVKAHDGSIGVAARPSGGLDLRVELPRTYTAVTSNRMIPAST